MALNIKPIMPLEHPDYCEHVHESVVELSTGQDHIDLDKDMREDGPKDHNLDIEKNLLKINIISS